jgi:hypothetical protein
MTPAPEPTWSHRTRVLASVLVVFHVTAVFVGAFSASPTSVLGDRARSALRPYIEAADLHHGYRFFNIPGPSHRVRYVVEFADGRAPTEGVFPNRKDYRPRLRYHRYFMLTESLESLTAVSPEPPPGTRPGDEMYEAWRKARDEFNRTADAYAASYARHLLAVHGGSRVTLWGLERGLPSMEDVRNGISLDDKRFHFEVKLGEWEAGE